MSAFSVLVLTAAPAGMASEAGGAFVKIDGREALLRSVELFLNRPEIKQVMVVFPADMMDEAKQRFGGHFGFAGVKLISGGTRWIEQMLVPVEKLAPEASHVIVHDGARPIVPYTDIDALLEAAETHTAVGLVSPVRSVLMEMDEGGAPLAYHPAKRFTHFLTPLAFSRDRYLQMARTRHEPHASEIFTIKGSPLNMRIGGPGDATVGGAVLKMLPKRNVNVSNPFDEAQW